MLQVGFRGATSTLLFLLSTFCLTLSGASICVQVTDVEDQPLPGARITAMSLQGGQFFHATSDGRGMACISRLPTGQYAVEAGLGGFLHVRYYPVRVPAAGKIKLRFSLPFGEITEGSLAPEAILNGTLRRAGRIVPGAKMCFYRGDSPGSPPVTCVTTDDLGEYALVLPVGIYNIDIYAGASRVKQSQVEMSKPGIYRNAVAEIHPDKSSK